MVAAAAATAVLSREAPSAGHLIFLEVSMILLLFCFAGAHHARAGAQEHSQVLRMVRQIFHSCACGSSSTCSGPSEVTCGRSICRVLFKLGLRNIVLLHASVCRGCMKQCICVAQHREQMHQIHQQLGCSRNVTLVSSITPVCTAASCCTGCWQLHFLQTSSARPPPHNSCMCQCC
jgi:hypothetical protein